MKRILPILFALSALSYSCQENRKKQKAEKIDFSKQEVLDSLIQTTSQSNDTLFLGFKIGMTKEDYKKHIKFLRESGKEITYSNSNKISSLAGTFDLGKGYTFKTNITDEIDGKKYTGKGSYFLEPGYSKNGELLQLTIFPIEKFTGDYSISNKPKWLEKRIKENSEKFSNVELKQALIDNNILKSYDFIRKKENLVIYENTLTINYIDLKALYAEILIKNTENKIIEEENEDVQF
ncbi:hypothetical protein [Christiangramia sabulilitoris]|uniref:Uncharacterized protein n=1 Tax=Christiangramia sabulilitoris TaxID=2583991 RepID=A0A550I719_9FLAO|nr:hypothetical protein [Christiangramia sabulilitoris]TRO66772.1 hypothetical protein FGM01_02460 [Christiangramia sabulilitoris]